MTSAYVLVDHVPGMKRAMEEFLRENRGHVVARRPVRWGNFNLLVKVQGRDDHEVDHFITDTLRFCPGVYTIERVEYEAAPDKVRLAILGMERRQVPK